MCRFHQSWSITCVERCSFGSLSYSAVKSSFGVISPFTRKFLILLSLLISPFYGKLLIYGELWTSISVRSCTFYYVTSSCIQFEMMFNLFASKSYLLLLFHFTSLIACLMVDEIFYLFELSTKKIIVERFIRCLQFLVSVIYFLLFDLLPAHGVLQKNALPWWWASASFNKQPVLSHGSKSAAG